MIEGEKKFIKCTSCRCYREEQDFLNDKGRRLKSCKSYCRSKFKCDLCDYKCVSNADLKKHKKIVAEKMGNSINEQSKYNRLDIEEKKE